MAAQLQSLLVACMLFFLSVLGFLRFYHTQVAIPTERTRARHLRNLATITDLRGQLRDSFANTKQCRGSLKDAQQKIEAISAISAIPTKSAMPGVAITAAPPSGAAQQAKYDEVDAAAKAASTIVKLGSSYGGWQFDGQKMSKDSVVYSVGLGEDISWDKALIEKYGCEVYGYDPTPKTIRYLRHPPEHFHYTPEGLAADGPRNMTFTMPKDPKWVSMRAGEHDGLGEKVQVTVNSLQNWMSHNGHSAIEVLKLDIEGAEYEVLKAWAKAGTFPPFRQLLIEFHWKMFAGCGMCSGAEKASATRKAEAMHAEALQSLYENGYRVVHKVMPHNKELTFVKMEA